MAIASTNITASAPVFGRIFRAIGNALISVSEANSRVRQVEALSALSDEQLKARGLRREDIVRHVFSDALYL
jgi:uncharacterized protein YjiS (DUF1127 family)